MQLQLELPNVMAVFINFTLSVSPDVIGTPAIITPSFLFRFLNLLNHQTKS